MAAAVLGPCLPSIRASQDQLTGYLLPEPLSRLPDLRVLWSSFVSATVRRRITREATASLRRLSTLTLDKNVECEALDFLRRNENLTRLTLGWALLDDDVEEIAACSSLRHLSVQFPSMQGYTTEPLARLSRLESLRIAGITTRDMTPFAGLAGLTSLEICRSEINGIDTGVA